MRMRMRRTGPEPADAFRHPRGGSIPSGEDEDEEGWPGASPAKVPESAINGEVVFFLLQNLLFQFHFLGESDGARSTGVTAQGSDGADREINRSPLAK